MVSRTINAGLIPASPSTFMKNEALITVMASIVLIVFLFEILCGKARFDSDEGALRNRLRKLGIVD